MNKSDFDAFVERQQAKEREEAPFDPKRQLAEWLGYLDALYKQITEFLDAYIKRDSAHIQYSEVHLNEDFSGPYTAPGMLLKIGRSTITFTPIGTMLIGSKGRVDVQGPLGTARLGLVNKKVTSARQLIQVTVTLPGQPRPAPSPPEHASNIEWAWKIITPPPEIKFIDLTQEAFFDMILSVADA